MIVLSPVFIVLLHAVLARTFPHAPRQTVAGVAGVITALLYTAAMQSLFAFVITLLFAHLYFHVFNMSETARRIRLLVGWKLGQPTYSADDMVSVRLQRLLDLKQIDVRDGRYFSRPSFLRFTAWIFDVYERMLFPKKAATVPPTRS